MRLADVHINGIGVHLPPAESAQSIVDRGILPAELVDRMGFTSAGVAGDLPAPEMALRAARDAVKQSGVSPGEVDLLLYADVWHQGPTSWQPQLYLQHHLVGDSTPSVEVRQGCVVLPDNMPREEGRAYLGMLGFTLERSTWEHGRALGHMGAQRPGRRSAPPAAQRPGGPRRPPARPRRRPRHHVRGRGRPRERAALS
jgi:hypothetical protein